MIWPACQSCCLDSCWDWAVVTWITKKTSFNVRLPCLMCQQMLSVSLHLAHLSLHICQLSRVLCWLAEEISSYLQHGGRLCVNDIPLHLHHLRAHILLDVTLQLQIWQGTHEWAQATISVQIHICFYPQQNNPLEQDEPKTFLQVHWYENQRASLLTFKYTGGNIPAQMHLIQFIL